MHNKPAYDKSHYQQEMMKIKQAQSQVQNSGKSNLIKMSSFTVTVTASGTGKKVTFARFSFYADGFWELSLVSL